MDWNKRALGQVAISWAQLPGGDSHQWTPVLYGEKSSAELPENSTFHSDCHGIEQQGQDFQRIVCHDRHRLLTNLISADTAVEGSLTIHQKR